MNRLDLIIDRLELVEKFDWNTLVVKGSVHEALAAAKELKALQPVAWMMPEYGDVLPANEADGTGIYNIPLYALEETK